LVKKKRKKLYALEWIQCTIFKKNLVKKKKDLFQCKKKEMKKKPVNHFFFHLQLSSRRRRNEAVEMEIVESNVVRFN